MTAFFYNHKGIECLFGSLIHYEIFIFYTFHIQKVLLYTTKKKSCEVNNMADVDPKLGELIKKTRLERRLTQEEVAEMIGCHSQYYTHRAYRDTYPDGLADSVRQGIKTWRMEKVCQASLCSAKL